jgi:hypothetical protein
MAAMHDWRERYGQLPSSYDWSRTHARRRGGEALGAASRLTVLSRRFSNDRMQNSLGRDPALTPLA